MLYYNDSGVNNNLPILFLHGLGTDADSWHFQFTSLPEKGYRIIAPDLPGFNRSFEDNKKWTIKSSADQVAKLMDKLGVTGYVVAGMSMGGTVALLMALEHPERIRGLILINTFASLKPKSLSEWQYFIKRGLKAFIMKPSDQAYIVGQRVFPREDQSVFRDLLINSIRQTNPVVYRRAMAELARFNVVHQLSQINVPTLVISGKDDTTVPLEAQKNMANLISGSMHVIIPKAGHGVMVDQPIAFNRCVCDFMLKIQGS